MDIVDLVFNDLQVECLNLEQLVKLSSRLMDVVLEKVNSLVEDIDNEKE